MPSKLLRKYEGGVQFRNDVAVNGNLTVDGTFSTTSSIPVASGGTGRTSLTAHSVIVGNGIGNASFVAPGASGYPLVSQGASSDPAFGQLSSAGIATDAVNGAKIDNANTFRMFFVSGLDLSGEGAVPGQITMAGAKVGDQPIFIMKMTDGPPIDGRSDFETAATANGGLKQTSLTNLSTAQYIVFLLARS